MDNPNDPISPARVRVVRIIVFAQTMGLVVFAAAIWVSQSRGPGPHGNGTYSLLAAALLAGLGTASIAFPLFILRQNLRRIARGAWQPPPGVPASAYASDSTKLFAVYLNTTIMGLALVEGAGIYCCVAYLLEGQPYVLALVAIAALLQIARFPTEGRLRAWMSRQLEGLEQERRRSDAPDAGR